MDRYARIARLHFLLMQLTPKELALVAALWPERIFVFIGITYPQPHILGA